MKKLSNGKCYFLGSNEEIEELARNFRQKTLSLFNKERNLLEPLDITEWLYFVVKHYGGVFDSAARSSGIITVYDKGEFLIHLKNQVSYLYNNFIIAAALGFYFLNYDRETQNVIFRWSDEDIAWQARRFGISLLMPKKDVFNYLKENLQYNPSQLNEENYRDEAQKHMYLIAGHFQLSVTFAKPRLQSLFKEFVENKNILFESFSTA